MVYEFSDLSLDLNRHVLTRAGVPVKLTKLSFKVLQVLVQAAPALVSQDELIDQVWGPNRVITPDNLSQRMKVLRQSLNDDPNNPIYVEGVRGEGYRLVPEVNIQSPGTSSSSPKKTRYSVFVVSLVVLMTALLTWFVIDRLGHMGRESATNSIETTAAQSPEPDQMHPPAVAVLPFANLSEDPSNQYFTDGIHDDLLTRISNIKEIKTISRTSVMTYRGSKKKLGTIANELGVSTILEGGVQRTGDQVRINLQLIDAETDAHIWAESYNRELTASNVFAVQAEISEAVAGALKVILTEDERSQLEKQPTNNLQALDAYFLGNQLYDQATSESVGQAILAYQAAIRFDPEFALAYSRQASAILSQVWARGLPVETQLEKSRPLIDRAILLDPQSSEAFIALGNWYQSSGDTNMSIQAYEQAMALGPNNANALLNYGRQVLRELSDPASAIELFKKAVELDPQNIRFKTQLARTMPSVGLTDEGIRIMEGIVAEYPDSAAGYRDLAIIFSRWKFRHDKGIKAMRRAFELDQNRPTHAHSNAYMHWRLADYDNVALWMNYIASRVPDPEKAHVYRGWAFIAQGNLEGAHGEFGSSNSGSELYWVGVSYLGSVDIAEGRPADAIERFKEYATEFDGRKSNPNFFYGLTAIKAYQALGEQDKAQVLIDELISIIEANPTVVYHDSEIHDASIYALSGQVEPAIAILEEWVSRGGATSLLQQDFRHGLGVLADDPRYQSILRTVNNRLSEQKANLARWQANGEVQPIPNQVTDQQ